jgi:hypothetical protein
LAGLVSWKGATDVGSGLCSRLVAKAKAPAPASAPAKKRFLDLINVGLAKLRIRAR